MLRACVVICLLTGSVLVVPAAVGQELLVNPSFTLPALSDCVEQMNVGVTGWVGLTRRNGDFFSPPCPRDDDGVHGSIQGWDVGGGEFRQSVSGLSSSTIYTFKGLMWLGKMSTGGTLTVTAEMRSGSGGNPNNLPLVAEQVYTLRHAGTPGVWLPFCVQGSPTAPATALTLRIRVNHTGLYGYAAHFDDFSLQAATNTNLVTLMDSAPISPAWGVKGDTVTATITGGGFTAGSNTVSSVKLIRTGFPDIDGTIQQVTSGSIVCSFDLTGAAMGPWTLKIRVDNAPNPDLYVPGAFVVAVPSLTNGSFELPSAPAVNCGNIQPIPGGPTDWGFYAVGTWDSVVNPTSTLFRDSDQFPPSCPPPHGGHYASSVADMSANWSAQPEPHIYQTIRVDNSKTYLFSGFLAGRGDHTASLELLDGDDAAVGFMGEPAAAGAVHVAGGDPSAYDWKFGFVQFQPTGDLMTVRWRVTTRSPGPHVSHADALSLQTCDAPPPEVTGIQPARVVNESIISATITGAGFSGGPTPRVLLSRTGMAASPVLGTNVTVVDDQTITADFNLFGVGGGTYDVVVLQGGCVGRADGILTVVAASFVNGGFELPDPGRPVDCGPPAQLVRGIPTGWSAVLPIVGGIRAGFDRDLDVKQPATCPPPSPGGNHYGSLSWDRGGEDVIAYQTVAATPGAEYTFGGIFAGGGPNDVLIQLRDGGLNGTVLASTTVYSSVDDISYDWRPASVTATATSDTITAVWLLRPPSGVFTYLHASHADGLTLTMRNPCNDPFADADGDGDVDMVDFALLQRCLAIGEPIPTEPEYCRCFDRNFDSAINAADIGYFADCGSGPGVPANPSCDN